MREQRVDERVLGIAGRRVNDEPGRLIKHDQVLIFVDDVECHCLRQRPVGNRRGQIDEKILSQFDPQRGVLYRRAAQADLTGFDQSLQPRTRHRGKAGRQQPVEPLTGFAFTDRDVFLGHPGKMDPNMRALKILVVLMGVALVVGTVALAVAVLDRINHPHPTAPSSASPPVRAVDLPEGARILAVDTSGDRVVIRAALADGSTELLILDLSSGNHVATILLRPKPARP